LGTNVDRPSFRSQSSSPRRTTSGARTHDLNDAFQLPIDGLFSDFGARAGSVHLPDEFTHLSAAIQLSIVRDWLRGLESARERALVLLYRETVGKASLTLPEKLAKFREICEEHGEDCPPGMARLLQQY
jgi:hypothetical protein